MRKVSDVVASSWIKRAKKEMSAKEYFKYLKDFKKDTIIYKAAYTHDTPWISKFMKIFKICILCRNYFLGWGNNPEPLSNFGECCKKCDEEKVIPARMNRIYGKAN
jgi:hypothetical protein